jgi:hypothetical protein
MKTAFSIAILAVLLVGPSPCFAVWEIESVSKERAKELGMEVRSERTGPDRVWVVLEFKTEGELKTFADNELKDRSSVELHIGEGDKPSVTAPLREDRTKPGRIVVGFTADQAQLDKLSLWVKVPGALGGTIYLLLVKDFVEPKKDR